MSETTETLEPLLVTLPQAANLLGIKQTKIGQLCRSRVLDRRHIGRRTVITLASIKVYVAGLVAYQ